MTAATYALGQAAWADPGVEDLTAAETAATIDQVDPSGAVVADLRPAAGGDQVASSNGTTVEIPKDPARGVELNGPAGPMTIDVPGANQAQDAKTVGDTVVYEAVAPSTDIAVQATANGGVRQLITIAGADAPHDYTFGVDVPDGARLEPGAGGAYEIVRGDELITHIDAPWARDAHGNPVATSYSVRGNQITQHVAFDENTAFPVTADPWFGNWIGCITGAGVPLGAALFIASYPPSWYYLSRIPVPAASWGRSIHTYVSWVGARCRAFIRS